MLTDWRKEYTKMISSNRPRSEPFPMQQGGGSFLVCIGAAIIFSAFSPRYAFIALGCGFAAGVLASVSVRLWRRRAGRPRPRALQIWMLVVAIAVEFALFAIIFPHLSADTDVRLIWFAALAIVAAHFLLMAWTFGPPIVLLALAISVWLAATFWLPVIPLGIVIGVDGVLKLVFGLAMMTQIFARPALSRAS
jgi:Family of unknown function (DUF6609)